MLKKHDWLITAIVAILGIVGVFTLISTNIAQDGSIVLEGVVTRQIVFLLVGAGIYAGLSFLDHTLLAHREVLVPIYIGTLLLLLYVLIAGPVINNVQRWVSIGGFQLQPSEFAKITVILMTASIMSVRSRFSDFFLAMVTFMLLIPILVLVYLEPHGSMTMMILIIWFLTAFTFIKDQRNNILIGLIGLLIGVGILLTLTIGGSIGIILLIVGILLSIFTFYSREGMRLIAVVAVLTGLLVGGIGVVTWNNLLKEYQRDRIETFFAPESVDKDQLFNVEQSKVAIGSAGIFGKGFGSGTQSRLKYLPENQTDFIFAAYSEQFGLIGSIFLLALYTVLILRIFSLGMNVGQHEQYGSMVLVGIAVMLLLQVFINIGTNTGIIPATGIPLPLISAGGSSVLATMIGLGLVQSVLAHQKDQLPDESFIDNDELLI